MVLMGDSDRHASIPVVSESHASSIGGIRLDISHAARGFKERLCIAAILAMAI